MATTAFFLLLVRVGQLWPQHPYAGMSLQAASIAVFTAPYVFPTFEQWAAPGNISTDAVIGEIINQTTTQAIHDSVKQNVAEPIKQNVSKRIKPMAVLDPLKPSNPTNVPSSTTAPTPTNASKMLWARKINEAVTKAPEKVSMLSKYQPKLPDKGNLTTFGHWVFDRVFKLFDKIIITPWLNAFSYLGSPRGSLRSQCITLRNYLTTTWNRTPDFDTWDNITNQSTKLAIPLEASNNLTTSLHYIHHQVITAYRLILDDSWILFRILIIPVWVVLSTILYFCTRQNPITKVPAVDFRTFLLLNLAFACMLIIYIGFWRLDIILWPMGAVIFYALHQIYYAYRKTVGDLYKRNILCIRTSLLNNTFTIWLGQKVFCCYGAVVWFAVYIYTSIMKAIRLAITQVEKLHIRTALLISTFAIWLGQKVYCYYGGVAWFTVCIYTGIMRAFRPNIDKVDKLYTPSKVANAKPVITQEEEDNIRNVVNEAINRNGMRNQKVESNVQKDKHTDDAPSRRPLSSWSTPAKDESETRIESQVPTAPPDQATSPPQVELENAEFHIPELRRPEETNKECDETVAEVKKTDQKGDQTDNNGNKAKNKPSKGARRRKNKKLRAEARHQEENVSSL